MMTNALAPDPWPTDWEAFEARVLTLVNAERARALASQPAPWLVSEPHLRAAARRHSWDMASTGRFDHTGSDGSGGWDRVQTAGYGAPRWQGENIAAGQTTPEGVVTSWMASPGHRDNMLTPSFRHAGVGYAFTRDSPAGHYWTLVLAAR